MTLKFLMTKIIYSLFACFLIVSTVQAQEDFIETKEPISSFAISRNDSIGAFMSGSTLYWVDIDKMKVLNKFTINSADENYKWEVTTITPNNNIIFLKKTPNRKVNGIIQKDWYRFDNREYPEDSIAFFDVSQQKIISKFSGNTFGDYTNTGFVAAKNDYSSFSDDNGKIHYYPKKGVLANGEISIESPGIIRFIKCNPISNEFALIYFNFDENQKQLYGFEVRNSETLELIHKKNFDSRLKKIDCSSDGKVWQVISETTASQSSSLFLTAGNLEEIKEFKEVRGIGYWKNNSIYKNDQIFVPAEEEIYIYNAKNFKLESRIWPNLTKLWDIAGFYPINTDSILVFNSKTYGAKSKNGIQKITLSQNEIFVKVTEVEQEEMQFFDPNKIEFSTNFLKIDSYNQSYKSYNDWLVIQSEGEVAFWNTKNRKKWRTFQLTQEASFFFDKKQMSALIFEDLPSKSYGDFKMSTLNLKTGTIKSKQFVDNPISFLDKKCDCESIDTNEWICAGYNALFRVNTEDLTIESFYEFGASFKFLKIHTIYESKVLISIEKNEFQTSQASNLNEGFLLIDLKDKSIKELENSKEWIQAYQINSNSFAYVTSSGIFVRKNDHELKIYDNKPSTILFLKDNIWLDENKNLCRLSYDGAIERIEIPYLITKLSGTENEILFLDAYKKDLVSYFPKIKYFKEWKLPISKSLLRPMFEISANSKGQIIWKNELLLDVNKLSSEHKFERFSNAYLFPTKPYVIYQAYNSNDKEYNLVIDDLANEKQTIQKSKGVESLLFPDIIISNTEEEVILYTEKSSLGTEKSKFIWWNLTTNALKTEQYNYSIYGRKIPHSTKVQFSFPGDKIKTFNIEQGAWSNDVDYDFYSNDPVPLINFQNVEWKDNVGRKKIFYAREYLESTIYLKNKEKLFAGSENGKVFVWSIDNSSPIKKIATGTTNPIVRFIELPDKLIAVDKSGFLHFIDPEKLEWTVSVGVIETGNETKDQKYETIWFTPEGYYSAEKTVLKYFNFIQGEKIIPLNSYDIYLNRPDKIIGKLTNNQTELIDAFTEVYQKRLKKMGLTEGINIWEIEKPEILLKADFVPPIVTQDNTLQIPLDFSADTKIVEIRDNGVVISSDSVKGTFISKTIVLHTGENNISIIAKNKEGVESTPLSFEIDNKQLMESKVYYIGIGVSEYQDSSMNLKYATKDIEKLKDYFERRYASNIEVHTFVNEQVTLEKLQEINEILAKTTVNDKVIISFSGHGLMNSNNDFIFASHDIDFSSPDKKGIPFSFIESLTKNIPARRRLILIDACNSGALDEEENIEFELAQNVKEHGIKGMSQVKSTTQETINSYELMQRLFYDFQNNDGTYIIAASGGKEYSYEGDEWQSGVFTYSLIQTLNEKDNDNWRGSLEVPISTLQKEVYKKVKALTKGKQKPTSRSENPEWDWSF